MQRFLVVPLLVALSASGAHAQEKSARCSLGYAYVNYLEEGGGSVPFGLFFSAQSTKDLGIKGEIAYHRDSENFYSEFYSYNYVLNTFTGMVGPVVNYPAGSAFGFVHLLFGGREDRFEGEGNFAIGGELGVGFDIPAGTSVFIRPGIDYQIFTDDGYTLNILRLSAGISF